MAAMLGFADNQGGSPVENGGDLRWHYTTLRFEGQRGERDEA
jgi:hypothetical protein